MITAEQVGQKFFVVTFGTQTAYAVAEEAADAIRKVVRQMAIGRYRLSDWKSYDNEAGYPEVQARVRNKRMGVNFVIYAIETLLL